MNADLTKLNLHLLIALGLSRDSAEIVMERLNELESENAKLTHELKVANNWVEHHSKHADDLISENAKLVEESVVANGRLDMQMKELAVLRNRQAPPK